MIQDVVETMIRAACWRLLFDPPLNRFFSTRTMGLAYCVASGDETHVRRWKVGGFLK